MRISLPLPIRQEIAKLPAVTRDLVAQRLREPVSPPILYEEAVKRLAMVRDIDTTKRVYLAADGLALWGKLHEDNRAILEAQKLKAHALRQMFICAKMLGKPYEVLAEKKIWREKARRGEQLASFKRPSEIDTIAEEIGLEGRPDFLVGRIADESPLAKQMQRANQLQREENDRKRAEQQRKAAIASADPKQQFKEKVLDRLAHVFSELQQVEAFSLDQCTNANRKQMHGLITDILEIMDRIDASCKPMLPRMKP